MLRDRYGDEIGEGRYKYTELERMQYKLTEISMAASFNNVLLLGIFATLIVMCIKM